MDKEYELIQLMINETNRILDGKITFNTYIEPLLDAVYDITTDHIHGFSEMCKMKFKTIIEQFAIINRIFFDSLHENKDYLMKLINMSSNIKEELLYSNTVSEEDKSTFYNIYKNMYPNTKVSKTEVFNKISNNLWFLIDEKGKIPSLASLVSDLIQSLN